MITEPRIEPGIRSVRRGGGWMESEREQLRGLRKGEKISKRERERNP